MTEWTSAERRQLESNPNVSRVTKKNVAYCPEFKMKAIACYERGDSVEEFFIKAGIPLEFFPADYARLCVKRWRRKKNNSGISSLKSDGRGRDSRGRPRKDGLDSYSVEDLKAIINFQADFIEELKKMKALARKRSRKD
jgi:transposase